MRRFFLVVVLAALVVAGCSSSSSKTGGAVTTVPQPAASPPPTGPSIGAKPTVTVPSTPPPATLQVTDLVAGTGAAAKVGDNITVQYVGVSYTNKQQFDSSWDNGAPVTFPLAQGQLIDGWVQGIPGMKVGGRRQLIIPPALGYGANPPTPKIAPNDTLIFVIDLVKIG